MCSILTFSLPRFLHEWLLTFPYFFRCFTLIFTKEIIHTKCQLKHVLCFLVKYDFLFIFIIPRTFVLRCTNTINNTHGDVKTIFNNIPNITALCLKICLHANFPKIIVISDKAKGFVITATISKNMICGSHILYLRSKLPITCSDANCKYKY